MTIQIRTITKESEAALALPNDPFLNTGRVIPLFDGKTWHYEIEHFPEERITEDGFPDENYAFDNMGAGFHGLAAYVDGECAGFAVTYEQWNKYLYLDNLLVPARFRRQGVGTALIRGCMELAESLGKIGVRLVCQDNNLQAALFYFKNGFQLGGVDQRIYDGTRQEGKTDLFLYRRTDGI